MLKIIKALRGSDEMVESYATNLARITEREYEQMRNSARLSRRVCHTLKEE